MLSSGFSAYMAYPMGVATRKTSQSRARWSMWVDSSAPWCHSPWATCPTAAAGIQSSSS